MRILHILDHSIPLHDGYSFRTRSILQHQRALGWETEHVTGSKHAGEGRGEETVDGLRFFRTPASNGLLSRLPVANQWVVVRDLARRLATVIDEVRPDLLHAHSPALDGWAALRAAAGRLPVVYEVRAFWEDAAVDQGTSTEWGLRYRLSRALESHVLRRVQEVTTICEGLRTEILARGIPPAKVTVIPNAVDLAQFAGDTTRDAGLAASLGLEGKTTIGFLGSFYEYEGLAVLVDAMPSILDRRPDTRALLVGGGLQERALRDQVSRLGLDAAVIFTGRVPHDQVQRYYDLVDVLAYPRLRMRLTDLVTPLKPLEAMARERLVVASDVGGHRELIRDGETGRLFPAGDAGALARTVLDLLDDPGAWPRMRAAGKRFVERERNWQASVERYRDVYARALGQR